MIAILTAISSVDDMLVDLSYWCLKLFGRQDAKDREIARRAGEAAQLPERPFAIMVPAWKEHDVIFSMVATNSRLLAYDQLPLLHRRLSERRADDQSKSAARRPCFRTCTS